MLDELDVEVAISASFVLPVVRSKGIYGLKVGDHK
jgi:hypothetical protein